MMFARKKLMENSFRSRLRFIEKIIKKEREQMALIKNELIGSVKKPSIGELGELYEKLKEIDKKYSESGNSSSGTYKKPEYTKLEYDALTDEEIRSDAETLADKEYNERKKKLENEYLEKLKVLDSSRNQISDSAEDVKKGIEESYSTALKDVGNSLLKRGLARSSVAANLESGIMEGQAAALASAAADLNGRLAGLEKEITDLNSEREKALSELDIARAASVTERINNLKAERDEKMKEAVKYNNTIEEKIAEYEKYLSEQKENSSVSDNNSYKNSAEKEKISYLKNYFKGLSKKQAMEALLFSDIKNYISEETLKELSESI